jgi:hypothetical protein
MTLYQFKSLVNKHFLKNKFYLLRMNYGDFEMEHLNSFNIMIIKFFMSILKVFMNIGELVYSVLF